MYNIGVIGHRSGDFHLEKEIIRSRIERGLEVLKFQYDRNLLLNVDGEAGIGQDIIEVAQSLGIEYHMFLPTNIEKIRDDWTADQHEKLIAQYNKASANTIISNNYNLKSCLERDQKLVESSNFIICFWEGKRQGRTYSIIQYSLKNNKIVLNGLDELKLVSLRNSAGCNKRGKTDAKKNV